MLQREMVIVGERSCSHRERRGEQVLTKSCELLLES